MSPSRVIRYEDSERQFRTADYRLHEAIGTWFSYAPYLGGSGFDEVGQVASRGMASQFDHQTFGSRLRHWRQARNLNQLELAVSAGVSPRHLSFIDRAVSAEPSDGPLARR